MSPQPIKTLVKNPSINLVPEMVAVERPEVASWIAQGILNWTWIDTQIANLFIYLLGSNIRQGAEMYASLESDRVKEKTPQSLALAALSHEEVPVFDALLKVVGAHRAARNKLAHWYWGVCPEHKDGAIAVKPQYILRHRANLLSWHPGMPLDAGITLDLDEVYAFRIKSLKATANAFATLAGLVNEFSRAAQISEPEARARLFRELTLDARLAEALNPGQQADKKIFNLGGNLLENSLIRPVTLGLCIRVFLLCHVHTSLRLHRCCRPEQGIWSFKKAPAKITLPPQNAA